MKATLAADLWRALPLLAALLLLGVLPSSAARLSRAAPDSVTIRVSFKSWGGPSVISTCDDPDWGWKTLTVRAGTGTVIGYETFMIPLRVGRILSRDSVWLVFLGGTVRGRGVPAGGLATLDGWDSLRISSEPSELTTNTDCGGLYFRVSSVPYWPEPPQRGIKTSPLVGMLVDE